MAQPLSDGHQGPDPTEHHPTQANPQHLAGPQPFRHAPFYEVGIQDFHLIVVTVVPRPLWETIANSSIIRRTPGKPRPRPPDVEYPSFRTASTSGMPGPSSVAWITMPFFGSLSMAQQMMLPFLA